MLKKVYLYNNYDLATMRITGEVKEPIILSDTAPGVDYTEQTTVKELHDVLIICKTDNLYYQDKIRAAYLNQTWTSLTNEEKDIVINSAVGDNNTEKAAHLFATGKIPFTNDPVVDNAAVQQYLTGKWLENYPKNKEACFIRVNSNALDAVIGKYLTLEDAEDLQHTTRGLAQDYEKRGIRGVAHYGLTYGLIDYFNGTVNTPYENQSIKETKSYVMQNGDANMDNFVTDLLNVLLYGNY